MNSDSNREAGADRFLTTHWSAVLRAGQEDPATAREAMNELCRTYWYPLYAFIRRQGRSPHDAEDLTQSFFANLLEKNYVENAHRERGKFRTFLLTALKGFLANAWDREHAQKRGGFRTFLGIDQAVAESRFNSDLTHPDHPDVLFERQWAVALLDEVIRRLQAEYADTGRSMLFEHLRGCLVKDEQARPYAEIGATLNLSEAAIKTAVRRLRLRYQAILRDEIARTVVSSEEVEDELRQLFAAFQA